MIVLVMMPFAQLTHPALGISLLQAALRRHSLESRILYGNLLFADKVGLPAYYSAEYLSLLAGEWVFSQAAFGADAPPESLEYWRQELSRKGLPRQVLDLVMAARGHAAEFVAEMARRVLELRPSIVGCSSTFQQNCASLALLRELKRLRPGVVTVMGGANCEGVMGQGLIRNFDWLDYAISGESEEAFPSFCREVLEEGQPQQVYGVISASNLDQPPPRASVALLDRLPVPEFQDYFSTLEQVSFGSRLRPGLLLETSRGCWWGQKHHCTFCGLNGNGMAYRSKSSERVLQEMDQLSRVYGSDGFQVVDNILDMKHFQSVLPALSERTEPYRIFYETKANLKAQQVELLARAGVHWIQPGIESLSDQILALMDKGSTALTNLQLLRNCRQQGISVIWNFLVGFPGELPEWTEEMCEFLPELCHLQPPCGGTLWIRYDRFSPYHENPDRFGIRPRPLPEYSLVYPLSQQELAGLAYFFEDEGDLQRQPLLGVTERLAHLIQAWQETWKKPDPPRLLSFRDDGESLQILDTRPPLPPRRYPLEGLQRRLLLACDTPRTEAQLAHECAQPVAGALAKLVSLQLLLCVRGRYLSLVLSGACPRLPPSQDFPGGFLPV